MSPLHSAGADAAMIPQMDEWLSRYAKLTKMLFPESDPNCSGSGAAGGLGFALKNYLHAELESGIQIVMRETQLEQAIVNADLVITGRTKHHGKSTYRGCCSCQAISETSAGILRLHRTCSDDLQCSRNRCLFPDTARNNHIGERSIQRNCKAKSD